jgi:hypothetical protein
VACIPETAVLIGGGEFAPDDIGSEACGAADVTGEMALMGKARSRGDLGNGRVVLSEERPGALDTTMDDVLMNGKPHGLTEERLEVGGTESCNGGDLVERDVFSELIFDEGENLFEPVAGEGGGRDF